MMRLPVWSGLLVLALAMASGFAVAADNQARMLEKAEEWERAALNREWAAITRQTQAEEQLKCAQAFRSKEYLYERERKSNLNMAGDAEKRAGDLEGSALGNFDAAARNWEKVAAEYKRLRDVEKEQNARTMAESAHKNALLACGRAADAYELAAESYSERNADQPNKAAAVSEKAAIFREKLAGRR